jgi:hypothetical protein
MTDPGSSTSRRFNEKEVALIIKRASELQQNETTAESSTGTVCLWAYTVNGSSVDLVADAVGWTPGNGGEPDAESFFGALTVLRLERTIDGEVPTDSTSRWCSRCNVSWAASAASTLGTLQFSVGGTATRVGARGDRHAAQRTRRSDRGAARSLAGALFEG